MIQDVLFFSPVAIIAAKTIMYYFRMTGWFMNGLPDESKLQASQILVVICLSSAVQQSIFKHNGRGIKLRYCV
jgi:hypothetical protein